MIFKTNTFAFTKTNLYSIQNICIHGKLFSIYTLIFVFRRNTAQIIKNSTQHIFIFCRCAMNCAMVSNKKSGLQIK